MQKVLIVLGRTLSDQMETIPSRRRTVRLLVPGKLVLETPTDPTGLKLGKMIVFVNLHSKDPTSGAKYIMATKLAAVRQPDSVIVQVTLELFQFSSANFCCIFLLRCRRYSSSLDLVLLSQA